MPTPSNRAERYAALVAARQTKEPPDGLFNPSRVEGGVFDAPHIGPWTRWAHDLDADLMVIGQDWGDVDYFTANRGLDNPTNPTNKALQILLALVGRPVPEPPTRDAEENSASATCGVWLTNALPWLKTGGLSAPLENGWFDETAIAFLKEQVEIVQPRVVVSLGERAYNSILRAYELPEHRGVFRAVVENQVGVRLPTSSNATTLFGVYHCGKRIQNTVRSPEKQEVDWERIRVALEVAGK